MDALLLNKILKKQKFKFDLISYKRAMAEVRLFKQNRLKQDHCLSFLGQKNFLKQN